MRLLPGLILVMMFLSCNTPDKQPDVSGIKVEVTTRRFEKELFALDTNKLSALMDPLIGKYPSFGENFLYTILKFDPKWPQDSIVAYLKTFISYYRPVYDSAEKIFNDFSPYEKEIKTGLQFVQYYFPRYKIPHNLITYIGPLDGFGNVLDDDAIYIGLHQHLGKDFPLYKEQWLRDVYPGYVTDRFDPSYISVNCIKNIVADIYPEKSEDKSLLIQMIEKGKRLYLLNKLLPDKEEYKLIGYSKDQLKQSYTNEAQIWDLFVQNNFLQAMDNNVIKNYIGDSPKTQELGDSSPGNIGSFTGWQIVKKYMKKFPKTSIPQLMNEDSEVIFQQAKYKP